MNFSVDVRMGVIYIFKTSNKQLDLNAFYLLRPLRGDRRIRGGNLIGHSEIGSLRLELGFLRILEELSLDIK